MENKKAIGKQIREKRLSLNLRMDDVAKQANITRATLWTIENGNGNYTIDALLKVISLLNMSLALDGSVKKASRDRATRLTSALDKKINRFIIMCIEQYALEAQKDSKAVYKKLSKNGIIQELKEDYEDMHGMSTYSINEYIDSRLKGETV